jgi:hypothetical protein
MFDAEHLVSRRAAQVVGNQVTTSGANARPANLAVFRIHEDGQLEFVDRYVVAVGQKPLWWMGIVGSHTS